MIGDFTLLFRGLKVSFLGIGVLLLLALLWFRSKFTNWNILWSG